jgi:4-hydroxybenzoate polyprenyltransferase
MKLFLSYLRLTRPFNLIMIVFTLYMVRLCFILPVLSFSNFPLQVNELAFAMFALAFGTIAAGGYIINDYYDVEIDKVNKPGRGIVGYTVSPGSALTSYWMLNVLGIITGFWSCYKAGSPSFSLLFLFYLAGLWIYSYRLKSTFLFGNILIAVFLGLVPLASAYIELQADTNNSNLSDYILVSIKYGAWAISGFAFLSTLIREIVKDMEDMEGDLVAGCHTMPIVMGIKKVKIITQLLLLVMTILLGLFQYYSWSSGWHPTVYYVFVFIQFPCLIILFKIRKVTIPREFHGVSVWLKIVMFTGICYLFVFAYESYITLQFIHKFSHL